MGGGDRLAVIKGKKLNRERARKKIQAEPEGGRGLVRWFEAFLGVNSESLCFQTVLSSFYFTSHKTNEWIVFEITGNKDFGEHLGWAEWMDLFWMLSQ